MKAQYIEKTDSATLSGITAARSLLDLLRNSWFLIAFIAGMIYWVARQDSSLASVEKSENKIVNLESRVNGMELGLLLLQSKLDGIKEDVVLIKSAVLQQ